MSISAQKLSHKSKLIDSVKRYPDLWRWWKKAPSLKQKLWNAVGKELGTSGCDARRQWDIMRDQFRREFNRCKSEKNYKSRWIYYNRMIFMSHALQARDGRSLNSDIEEQQSPMDISQILEQSLVSQAELPKIQVRQDLHLTEPSGEASTSTGVSSSLGARRLRYESPDQSSKQRRRRRCCPESTDDEDYHFVMSILPSLQCIQQKKKLRVRSKIMELIATELESAKEEANSSGESRLQMKSEAEESDANEKSFYGDGDGFSD